MAYSPEATNKAVAINIHETALIDVVMTKIEDAVRKQANP